MSSGLNTTSKPVLNYANILKKTMESKESDKKSAPVIAEVKAPVIAEVKAPVIAEAKTPKKANKLSDAQYAKKLEKKASKKAELEKEDKERAAKLSEIDTKAQKVYDDEYQIQFIVCKTPEEAQQKAMSKRNKAHAKLLNEAFPKAKPVSESSVTMKIEELLLSEDEEVEKEVQDHKQEQEQVSVPVQTLTEEDLKGFQSVDKRRSKHSKPKFTKPSQEADSKPKFTKPSQEADSKPTKKAFVNNSSNTYNEMLNKACDTFIVDILSQDTLDNLESTLRKSDSTDRVYVSVNTDSDVISSFKSHNFTKSGFLKNTNYYFSKQLSKAINIKLTDLRVWVNIKNVKDNEYSIAFSQKH